MITYEDEFDDDAPEYSECSPPDGDSVFPVSLGDWVIEGPGEFRTHHMQCTVATGERPLMVDVYADIGGARGACLTRFAVPSFASTPVNLWEFDGRPMIVVATMLLTRDEIERQWSL